MKPTPAEHDAIEATAAEWLARRDRKFTSEEAVAFARWRMADPRHHAAVAELELVWGALGDLAVQNGQQRAGDAAAASPAQAVSSVRLPGATRRNSHGWWRPVLALAAALVIVAGVLVWRRAQPMREATVRYQTEIGRQKKVGLEDGSTLHLNTNTAVTVRFDATTRRVVLERGEAFFDVAKNPTRPFIVTAGRTEARVLGTKFSIRLREQESELIVSEGRVRFGTAAATVEVGAAQRAVAALTGTAPPRVEILDRSEVDRLLAWQTGSLIFKDTPLSVAVAEFNRYHRQQLAVRDAAAGGVLIGGSFALDNLDGFVRLLPESAPEIVVVDRNAERIVLGLYP
jgi:transmembrane sensor